jgi:hypothetical protein
MSTLTIKELINLRDEPERTLGEVKRLHVLLSMAQPYNKDKIEADLKQAFSDHEDALQCVELEGGDVVVHNRIERWKLSVALGREMDGTEQY